jgi:hypothetical protein
LFLKLSLQPSPQYGLSQHFNILNLGDLGQVLGILQNLGQLSLAECAGVGELQVVVEL